MASLASFFFKRFQKPKGIEPARRTADGHEVFDVTSDMRRDFYQMLLNPRKADDPSLRRLREAIADLRPDGFILRGS